MVASSSGKLPFGAGSQIQRMVPISKLDLDLTNARFRDDAKDQDQALEFMLSVAGEKCLGLLKDMCAVGDLNPSDIPIVVVEGNRYRMLEGNRRLTCLKIWRKPALLNSLPQDLRDRFQKRFEAVIRQGTYGPPDAISVVIVKTPEEADEWIDKKHGLGRESGASTVDWNAFEKDRRRFRRTNKKSQSFSFVDMLNAEYGDDVEMMQSLTTLLTVQYTILSRILTNSVMREEVGIRYASNGRTQMDRTAEQMRPFLARLLHDLATKEMDSRKLHDAPKVANYLEGLMEQTLSDAPENPVIEVDRPVGSTREDLPKEAVPDNDRANTNAEEAPASSPKTGGGDESKPRVRKPPVKIFDGLVLDGFSTKTNDLVKSTAKLSANTHPDVVAILLRVILDITCFQFLEEFARNDPPKDLDKRILAVLKILDPQATDQLKHAETARPFNTLFHTVKDDPNHLKLTQFVVHSSTFSTTAAETKRLADRYEPMLVAMNERMRQNKSS